MFKYISAQAPSAKAGSRGGRAKAGLEKSKLNDLLFIKTDL